MRLVKTSAPHTYNVTLDHTVIGLVQRAVAGRRKVWRANAPRWPAGAGYRYQAPTRKEAVELLVKMLVGEKRILLTATAAQDTVWP